MNDRVIGRIVTISHNNIMAELSNDVGNYVSIYDGIRFVGEIGSYVAIDDINRRIIAETTAVDEKNELSSDRLIKAGSRRYLRIRVCSHYLSVIKTNANIIKPLYMMSSLSNLQNTRRKP